MDKRICCLFFSLTLTSLAFPPAPHYTLYGMVRDQTGQVISSSEASVVLTKGDTEVSRTPITSGLLLDQNYELRARIDQGRTGTTSYSEKAITAQGLFGLEVELNGIRFYPIEVAGDLVAGQGGERKRLDLNLGEDSDLDGLPDAWEQWQLFQAGYHPDDAGIWQIDLIDRDGDFDKDGQSNYFEYLTGTFAGDATETFALDIKEKLEDGVHFEFYAITGKTYTIECSIDAKSWESIAFAAGDTQEIALTYQADAVGILPAITLPSENSNAIYRLTVR